MKTVLITGAAGGLGSAFVREYLKDGYFVIGCDVRQIEEEELKKVNHFFYFKVDIRYEEQIKNLAEKLKEIHIDAIDVLINCAGILPENSAHVLEEFEIDGALDVFNVNALGALRMVKIFLAFLKKGDEKQIINISSEAGSIATHAGYTYRYDYCMSKAALNIQSVILQRYLWEDGLKVFLFHPGWMRTRMGGEQAPIMPELSAKEIKRTIEEVKNNYEDIRLIDYNGVCRPW